MQDVFMNENVLKILPQMQLESPMTLSADEKKKKVDKIKNLLNQRKLLNTQATRTTEKLMVNLSISDSKTSDMVQTEISSQNEIFKKKLEQKRAMSNPHKKINNKLKETKPNQIIQLKNTPIVNITTIESKVSDPKEENKFNTFLMGKSHQKAKFARRRQASVIYEDQYEGKLEELLVGLWSTCSKITKESTIDKMESVYSKMSEKFLKESMNIILKYNNELKDIDEGDLNDPNNVNVIIYNQLISDRDNELKELKESINREKMEKLEEIRGEQFGLYDKVREISKVKIDVLQELIRTKILESQKNNNNNINKNKIKDEEDEEDDKEEKKGIIDNNSDDNDTKKNERISRLSINEVKNTTENSDLRVSVLWNN